jgi:hypothetical protein
MVKTPRDDPKARHPTGQYIPADRDVIADVLRALTEVQQQLAPDARSVECLDPGTVFSIPLNHFNSCLALADGAPFDLARFVELMAYLDIGVLFDQIALVMDASSDAELPNVGAAFKLIKDEH